MVCSSWFVEAISGRQCFRSLGCSFLEPFPVTQWSQVTREAPRLKEAPSNRPSKIEGHLGTHQFCWNEIIGSSCLCWLPWLPWVPWVASIHSLFPKGPSEKTRACLAIHLVHDPLLHRTFSLLSIPMRLFAKASLEPAIS